MSYSFNRSSGQSSSTPSNMYSAQSALAQQLAALDAALGQQTYNWAAQTYAADTAMTQQSVQNYLQMSQLGLGLAQQNLQDYNNIYRPEMAQLANEAGSYSSAARQQVNMGAAEAQSEAGSQAGLQAAQQQLQGYGINPNSGMYAELLQSQQAAAGAAAAGAGQEAGLATQNTGRQLLQASLQQGDQLPAAAVNALNSAYQGVAGAENSTLANANTGVNLFDAANPYMQTAMQLKYPPIGNTQQSTNSGISNSNSQPKTSNASGNNSGYQAPGAIPGQPNQHLTQPGPGNYNNNYKNNYKNNNNNKNSGGGSSTGSRTSILRNLARALTTTRILEGVVRRVAILAFLQVHIQVHSRTFPTHLIRERGRGTTRIHPPVFRLMHSEALLPRVLIHLAGPLLTRSQANRISRLE